MIQEPFANGKSWIHEIDPRLRVLLASLYAVVTAVSYRFDTLIVSAALALLLTVAAGLDLGKVLKQLAVVAGFVLLIWIVLPVTFPGEVLFSVGPLEVTRPGLVMSAQITLKTVAILFVFIVLVTTMPITTLGHTFGRLGVPAKLVFLLLITYRYIFVIEQEYTRIYRAARIRGFKPGTNLHSYRTWAYMLGMLFVRASLRADRVHSAMKCRGFDGKFYSLKRYHHSWRNHVFALGLGTGIIILLLLEVQLIKGVL